ncbi:MAG: hypothetical protein L0206_21800 [Actinobacteria bacterium]|nr:hypothetical protein [Actinomycetota bacterium]
MAQIRPGRQLSLAERRALRIDPAKRRARARTAAVEARGLVDAGDLDGAEAVLMHAYHEGTRAVELWLAGIELAEAST